MSKSLTPSRLVGLVKFGTRAEFDECVTDEFVKKLRAEKCPLGSDQVVILGTVGGVDILEIRFLKTKTETMQGKAVKKPIPIDWFKHDSSSNQELLSWIKSFGQDPDEHLALEGGELKIKTMEGHSYGVPDGYIIIRGIKGEFYPCDPEVFRNSYDIVNE